MSTEPQDNAVGILQADMAEVRTDIHYMREDMAGMREDMSAMRDAINKLSDQFQTSNAALLEVLQGISDKLDESAPE